MSQSSSEEDIEDEQKYTLNHPDLLKKKTLFKKYTTFTVKSLT